MKATAYNKASQSDLRSMSLYLRANKSPSRSGGCWQALSVNMLKKLISYFKKSEAIIPSGNIEEEIIPIDITRYGHTQGHRQWELRYEDVQLVILKRNTPSPQGKSLLAFKPYGDLIWELKPHTKQESDCIDFVRITNGNLIACSYSCYNLKIDYKTGEVLETHYTK